MLKLNTKRKSERINSKKTLKSILQDSDQLLTFTETVLRLNDMLFLFYCIITLRLSIKTSLRVPQKKKQKNSAFKIIRIKKSMLAISIWLVAEHVLLLATFRRYLKNNVSK